MVDAAGPRVRGIVRAALWLAAIGVAGYHLALEASTLGLAEPMGMSETVYASIMHLWPHQYQWGHFVLGQDNYGPGYPALCSLFLLATPDVYLADRLANLASIAAACALLAWLLRRNRCRPEVTAGVVAIFFAANAGSFSIEARPDFLAVLEMIAVLAMGQRALEGRLPPARFGVLLGLVALAGYLTKPYTLFAWGAALSGLAVLGRFRFSVAAGLVSGALVSAGVWSYAASNPLYRLEAFAAHVARTSLDFGWFVHQSADFSVMACAPLAGGIACGWIWIGLRRRPPREAGDPASNPDLLGYWAWVSALAALALICGLGWHDGAYLTYFLHLALAPLCVCTALASRAAGPGRAGLALDGLVLANLAVLMAIAPGLPAHDPGWDELRADVLGQPGRVMVDFLMEPMAHERSGVSVADTGFVRFALDLPAAIGGHSADVARAQSEVDAFTREQTERMRLDPPQALYLQCAYVPNPDGPPGSEVLRIQNGLVWCAGPSLRDYVGVRSFRIHPYYFGTNGRRQSAGRWEVLVIKFARKGR